MGNSFIEGLLLLPKHTTNSLSDTLHCSINSRASVVWVGVSNDEDDNDIFRERRSQKPQQCTAIQDMQEKDQ